MVKRKTYAPNGSFSLILAVVILLFVIAIGIIYGYYKMSALNRPQFDPSAPETLMGENREVGFTFLYPQYFKYDKNDPGVWTVVNAKGSGTLTFEDTSQQPYTFYSRFPQFGQRPKISPIYRIQFAVISHTADAGVFGSLNRFPKKETLSLGAKKVTGYSKEYNDNFGRQHFEEIVVIPVNGFDYFCQYISNQNPYQTGDKYLDVFHKIISTMKFLPATQQMINLVSLTPPAAPTLSTSNQ